MIDQGLIESLVKENIEGSPYFIVDVQVRVGNKILIEVDGDEGFPIDQCVALSRHVESQLDREEEDFELEVASPGLSNPLKIPRQYQKNLGREVKVLKQDGERLRGIIEEVDDEHFTLLAEVQEKVEGKKKKQTVEKEYRLAFLDVKETKIVIVF